MKQSPYCILPNGKRVNNMKESHTKLGVGSTAFRNLLSKGTVKKIEVKQLNT